MAELLRPRYPVYIPSRGRPDIWWQTARHFAQDQVPYKLVVEAQERDQYAARFGLENLLVLPFQDRGLMAVRNWIKEHAIETGAERHWQIDDNMKCFERRWKGRRVRVDCGVALRAVEDFTDRYENVAISGLNYHMFVPDAVRIPPYYVNRRVYSCTLVRNSDPYRWRTRYNDDVDMCLQVLADGWCTLLVNAFLADKVETMALKGGNTGIYQGDGRLKMARSLERLWPGVATTKRRFRRPQHVVDWYKFDTPLRLRPGVDLAQLAKAPNEYGLALTQIRDQVESPRIQALLDAAQETRTRVDVPRGTVEP